MVKKKRLRTKPADFRIPAGALVRTAILATLAACVAYWALVHRLQRVPEPMFVTVVSASASASAPSAAETEIPAPELVPK